MNNQIQSPTSGININSKHYINQLESTIIQIAKSIAMEKQVPVDPTAKEITRKIVQDKLNTLLSKEALDILSEINKLIDEGIKESTDSEMRHLLSSFRGTMKLMGIDNV